MAVPARSCSRSRSGFGLAGVFVVGALIVREIGPLRDQIVNVLDFASSGHAPGCW